MTEKKFYAGRELNDEVAHCIQFIVALVFSTSEMYTFCNLSRQHIDINSSFVCTLINKHFRFIWEFRLIKFSLAKYGTLNSENSWENWAILNFRKFVYQTWNNHFFGEGNKTIRYSAYLIQFPIRLLFTPVRYTYTIDSMCSDFVPKL